MKKIICGLFAAACAFTSASHADTDVSTNQAYEAVNDGNPKEGECYGTSGLANACYDTSKIHINYAPLYTDCVYTGGTRCSQLTISAPVPVVAGAVTLECGILGGDCIR